jgi:hypothetical protein
MEYYSASKKDTLSTTLMNLEDIILMNQTQKDKCYMISLNMWNLSKAKLTETKNRMVVVWG